MIKHRKTAQMLASIWLFLSLVETTTYCQPPTCPG